MRQKFADEGSDVQAKSGENTDKSQGAARAISSFIDPGLSWKVRLSSPHSSISLVLTSERLDRI